MRSDVDDQTRTAQSSGVGREDLLGDRGGGVGVFEAALVHPQPADFVETHGQQVLGRAHRGGRAIDDDAQELLDIGCRHEVGSRAHQGFETGRDVGELTFEMIDASLQVVAAPKSDPR